MRINLDQKVKIARLIKMSLKNVINIWFALIWSLFNIIWFHLKCIYKWSYINLSTVSSLIQSFLFYKEYFLKKIYLKKHSLSILKSKLLVKWGKLGLNTGLICFIQYLYIHVHVSLIAEIYVFIIMILISKVLNWLACWEKYKMTKNWRMEIITFKNVFLSSI